MSPEKDSYVTIYFRNLHNISGYVVHWTSKEATLYNEAQKCKIVIKNLQRDMLYYTERQISKKEQIDLKFEDALNQQVPPEKLNDKIKNLAELREEQKKYDLEFINQKMKDHVINVDSVGTKYELPGIIFKK